MPPSPGRVRQLEAFLSTTVVQELRDTNLMPSGIEEAIGVKVEKAKTASIKGRFSHGFMWAHEARGYNAVMPSTVRRLSASITDEADKQIDTWELTPAWFYDGISLPGPLLHLNELGDSNAIDLVTTAADDMMNVREIEAMRRLWGDGSARLCTIQAVANSGAATFRVKHVNMTAGAPAFSQSGERGAKWLRPGRYVTIVNPATGAVVCSGKILGAQQDGVGYDTVRIYPALSANLTPGMILVPGDYDANAYGQESNGFANIFDPALVEQVHLGIDRSQCPEAGMYSELDFTSSGASGVAEYFVQFIPGLLRRIHRIFNQATGEREILWLLRGATKDELAWRSELRASVDGDYAPSSLMAQANQGGAMGQGKFYDGVAKYTFMDEDVKVSFVVDNECAPPNEALGLIPGNVTRFVFEETSPLDPPLNSSTARRADTTKDVNSRYYRGSENVMSKQPWKSARIRQLLTTDERMPIR